MEDVKELQGWLATDEVQKDPDLEKWVKGKRSNEYSLENCQKWVLKLLDCLFPAATAANERNSNTH